VTFLFSREVLSLSSAHSGPRKSSTERLPGVWPRRLERRHPRLPPRRQCPGPRTHRTGIAGAGGPDGPAGRRRRSAAALFGSTFSMPTPSLPSALSSGASVRPRRGTSVPFVDDLPAPSMSALACFSFGSLPRVMLRPLLLPFCRPSSLTVLPGASPPMTRASSPKGSRV